MATKCLHRREPAGDAGAGPGETDVPGLPFARSGTICADTSMLDASLERTSEGGRGGVGHIEVALLREPSDRSRDLLKGMIPQFLALLRAAHERSLSPEVQADVAQRLADHIAGIRGRVIAIKVVDPRGNQDLARRILSREVESVIRADLPGAPMIFGGTQREASGTIDICMEFIDGCDGSQLNAAAFRSGGFDVRTFSDLAARESLVLHHAHRAGLIHRDVKPSNFMVSREGDVKLVDFGLVLPEDPGATRFTEADTIQGTADYISPEQARGVHGITPRTDVFSYGMMLLERVLGEIPLRGGNKMQTIHGRLQHFGRAAPELVVPHPDQLSPDPRMRRYVRERLLPMLCRMIDGNPARRPAMEEVARFFQHHSSFTGLPFETEWEPHDQYGAHRVALASPEGDGSSQEQPEADGPAAMYGSLKRGAALRARNADFLDRLDDWEYAGPELRETVVLPGGSRRRTAAMVSATAAGILAVAYALFLRDAGEDRGVPPKEAAVAPAEDGGGGGAPARPEFRNLACGDHSIGRGGNGDVLLVYWRNLAEEGRNLSRNHLLAETYRTDDGDGALRCALPSFIVQRFREFAGERGAAAGPPKASRLVAVSIGETVLAFVPGEGYCVFDPEQERPEDQYRAFADESSCRTYLGPERLGRLREMMFTVAMGPGEKGVEGKEGRDERGRRELMDGGREKALAALHADIQAFLWESETVQILPDPTVVRDVP